MLDLSAILGPLLAGGNPLYVALGAVALILWQRFGPARTPNPAPGPLPSPAPAPSPTGRPLLDILGGILGGILNRTPAAPAATLSAVSIPDLARARDAITAELTGRAEQLRSQLAGIPAPEPARPVV